LAANPAEEEFMSQFLFVLTRGPEDPTRAVRCFQFAKIAADKGHEVTVFLVDDAVYLTNLALSERLKAPTGDELLTYWKFLVARGASLLVCKPCAETRMVGEDDLPPGTRISTGATLIDLAAESQVFTF
jgi:predicted peroxiredoxin